MDGEQTFDSALRELAHIDAHSFEMAKSRHYNLSEKVTDTMIAMSYRAYVNIMHRNPIKFDDDALDVETFTLYYLGRKRRKVMKAGRKLGWLMKAGGTDVSAVVEPVMAVAVMTEVDKLRAAIRSEGAKVLLESVVLRVGTKHGF